MPEKKLRSQDERNKLRNFLIATRLEYLAHGDVKSARATGRTILILDWLEGEDNPIGLFIEVIELIDRDAPDCEFEQMKKKLVEAVERR